VSRVKKKSSVQFIALFRFHSLFFTHFLSLYLFLSRFGWSLLPAVVFMDNLIIFSRDLSRHPLCSLSVRLSISVVCAAVIVHDHTAAKRQNCFRRRSIVFRELLLSSQTMSPSSPPTERTETMWVRAGPRRWSPLIFTRVISRWFHARLLAFVYNNM